MGFKSTQDRDQLGCSRLPIIRVHYIILCIKNTVAATVTAGTPNSADVGLTKMKQHMRAMMTDRARKL